MQNAHFVYHGGRGGGGDHHSTVVSPLLSKKRKKTQNPRCDKRNCQRNPPKQTCDKIKKREI